MPDKFIVPQFIENEDKILGPISVRQFLICLVGVLLIFISYKILATPYFIVVTILVAGIGGTFGFLKVNGQAFHLFALNALITAQRGFAPRVWDKNPSDDELRLYLTKAIVAPVYVAERKQRPESTRLRDMSLVVNTGGVYKPEDTNF